MSFAQLSFFMILPMRFEYFAEQDCKVLFSKILLSPFVIWQRILLLFPPEGITLRCRYSRFYIVELNEK